MRRRKGPRRQRLSLFQAGAIGIVAIIVFSYLAYTKFANPFASQYTIHAVFSSANGLNPDSLVRIAGINVGRVASVTPVAHCKVNGSTQSQCQAADVTIELQNTGLPLHKDATFAIRPRIFLEGNFFVDVHPGSPSAPRRPGRLHVSDPAGHGARPARSGPDLAAGRYPQEPSDPAPAIRRGGEAGRALVQLLDSVLAAGVRVLGDRRP